MVPPDLSIAIETSAIPKRTVLTNAFFDILTLASAELDAERDKETLKALCRCSPDLWCYLFHRIYGSINLRDEEQCRVLLYFVQRKLVMPLKVPKIRLRMKNDSIPAFRAALQLFENSAELTELEIYGSEVGQSCPDNLVSSIIKIVSTATKPLTLVFVNIASVPWVVLSYARHLEFRHSSLAPHYAIPAHLRQLYVETLACTTDTNQSSFQTMAMGGVHFPNLTHLLIKYKPSKRDLAIVDGSLAIVLDSNDNVEEITINYERDPSLPLSYTAYAIDNLVQVLCMISATRPGMISLHFDFKCHMYHAFDVISCLDSLEEFRQISVAVPCSVSFGLILLKQGYHRLVAGGMNGSFRVDCKTMEQSSLVICGYTVKDSMTTAPTSRARSHYNVCPRLIQQELGREVAWQDKMISVNEL